MNKRFLYVSVVGLLMLLLAACGSSKNQTPEEVARPSNPGGPGDAVNLTGDPASGKELFATYCAVCHGDEGKGGVENEGTADGTVPSLNPAADDLWNSNFKTFAYNADLFIEHGSTPEMADGQTPPPPRVMANWGDAGTLTPQQIADLISYIYSLNEH